jgi:drug/metabolite transporter (DMT)-like permease
VLYSKIVQEASATLMLGPCRSPAKSAPARPLEDAMANTALFLATVLIWGTTWFAIALQVGPVPVLVSVFYRFAAAALVFLAALLLLGRLRLPTWREQPFILLQAACLFSLNFLCFYAAENFIPSGLVSVIFSLATVFNALNAKVFFGDSITPRALAAGTLGVVGLALLFLPDIAGGLGAGAVRGIGLAALGTLFFSFGNMVSRRNSRAGLSPMVANAWGMAYAAIALLGLIELTGTPIVAPPDMRYLVAMLYLAVVGSVVGFTTYLLLVSRIGSARAAYATVFFPIVALLISTEREGYHWYWTSFAGLALTVAGNLVMFASYPASPRRFASHVKNMSHAERAAKKSDGGPSSDDTAQR